MRIRICEELRNDLPDFLRGRQTCLSVGMSAEDAKHSSNRKRIEAHLATCASCREEAASLEKTFAHIEEAPSIRIAPPETYWRNFLPRLHDRLRAKEQSHSRVAPWVEKFLIPSAGLLATVLLLIHIEFVSEQPEQSSELRQILTQMTTEEFQNAIRSPAGPLAQPFAGGGIVVSENGRLATEETVNQAIDSFLGLSHEEIDRLSQVSLLGATEVGFELLSEEEAEEVLRHLQSTENM